ncbi:ComF family protein, partial [Nonomuraea lactucae]|uniref:ComF family protein n=1 Tax=Nonomuraea lactucae TaxID=2249762 RepID=UPI003B832F6A
MGSGMLGGVLSALLDLVLPRPCVGCGAAGDPFCGACLGGVADPARRLPVPCPAGLPDCWSAAEYAGPVRRAVIAYKERAQLALAVPLADALAFTVARAVESGHPAGGGFALVPVPSARRARRAR